MALVALLPERTLGLLRTQLPREEIKCAANWRELDALAAMPDTTSVMLDPGVGGPTGLEAAIGVIGRHSSLPVFAYVALSARSLKEVFTLARHGLTDAFCCTEFNPTVALSATLDRVNSNALPFSFLSLVEARLGQLPCGLAAALRDAFERPEVYDNVSDLARRARLRARGLSREIERAGLGTPKKLLAVAKVLRGVSHMQTGSMSLTAVSFKLRYSDPRVFRDAIVSIFGCSPSLLRKHCSSAEVLLHVSEWLYKPSGRRVHKRFQAARAQKSSRRRQ
ncbi:MAG TPA: hypothetical protein VJ852_07130 [Gemmatimonadaceae bacterium]|nr:hypothetical protein [Gemmatimonadaceae bacterium]